MVKIGGMSINMLWDSGSQISLIDHRVMSKICKNHSSAIKRLPHPKDVLCTANGKNLEVLAMYSLTIRTTFKTMEAPFYVVKNLLNPMIAGCDLMEMYNVTLDMRRRKVHIGKPDFREKNIAQAKILFRAENEIKLSPLEEKRVFVKIPTILNNESEVLFENSPTQALKSEVIIPEAYCPVKWANYFSPGIYLVFVNSSKDHRIIRKKRCFRILS